jgi:hypothetical protein
LKVDAIRIRPRADHTEVRVYFSASKKEPTEGQAKKAALKEIRTALKTLQRKSNQVAGLDR